MTPEHIAASKGKIPMGRLPRTEEVGVMVSWIVGPGRSFTTGFAFDITGWMATHRLRAVFSI